MISLSQVVYGRESANKIEFSREPGIKGARMLIESFYYAFNHRDFELMKRVWADEDLIQLNNPLGGILRGFEDIAKLYGRVFTGSASVWVEFSDIVEFETENMVVFAGRERGECSSNNQTLSLAIRTTRIVQWINDEIGWRQVHHHGSIDQPEMLAAYQVAVKGR